ncbi:C-type lectin domain family 5 member A-like [Mytilus edulis]|uniref:C-type lectin domain family 5 member A-like n=1 Tax=Mytilus edulis TaxID=6550 RepID=UPI0039EF176E
MWKMFRIVLLVIVLAQREPLAASQGVVCPTGFQNVHGSCYWVSITPTTWKAATVICQSHNAHLADFSTDDEIVPVMLHAVIPKSSSFKYRDPKVWIDAVYSPSKRHWIWSHDSSLVNYRYFSQLAHSPGTTERCVFAIVNTGIHPWAHVFDVNCENNYLPLCETRPI